MRHGDRLFHVILQRLVSGPRQRFAWRGADPLYVDYYDIFEGPLLKAAQVGLSWITILRKRVQHRKV